MAFELRTEKVTVWEKIADLNTSTIVENDIIVPDIKPDISRVIIFDGECRVYSVETMYGRVVVNCKNRYKAIYLSDDAQDYPRSIDNVVKVSFALDVPEVRSGMEAEVSCKVEHLEYQILNSRKLGAKAVIGVKLLIRKENIKEIAKNIEGSTEVQLLRNFIEAKTCQNKEYLEEPVRESFELPIGKPAIREILRSDIRISNKKVREYDGKVQLNADVIVSTLYAADDETYSLNSMENAFEFLKEIDLNNEYPISDFDLSIQPNIELCEAGEDSDGEKRLIEIDAVLSGYLRLYSDIGIDSISDAYAVGSNLIVDRRVDSIDNTVFRNSGQVFLKEQIDKNYLECELAGVFNVISEVEQIEATLGEDSIVLNGVVSVNLIGASTQEEYPVFFQKFKLPFNHKIEFPSEKHISTINVDAYIESTSYSLGALGNVELRIVLNFDVTEQVKMEYATVQSLTEQDNNRFGSEQTPSVIVYFAQIDDTLWDVAKRYNTTIEDIVNLNNLVSENVELLNKNLIVKCGK